MVEKDIPISAVRRNKAKVGTGAMRVERCAHTEEQNCDK